MSQIGTPEEGGEDHRLALRGHLRVVEEAEVAEVVEHFHCPDTPLLNKWKSF